MPINRRKTGSAAFDQRAVIQVNQAASSSRNTIGSQAEDWVDSFTEWVAYESMPSKPGGAEYGTDEQRVVEEPALFRMRYHQRTAAISAVTHRVLYNNKTWNITRVDDPGGKHVEIHLESRTIG